MANLFEISPAEIPLDEGKSLWRGTSAGMTAIGKHYVRFTFAFMEEVYTSAILEAFPQTQKREKKWFTLIDWNILCGNGCNKKIMSVKCPDTQGNFSCHLQ